MRKNRVLIMVSSLKPRGGDITTRTLAIGAIGCVAKPSLGGVRPSGDVGGKMCMAAGVWDAVWGLGAVEKQFSLYRFAAEVTTITNETDRT